MWESLKEYLPIAVHWDREGNRNHDDEIIPYLTPTCLYLENGGEYAVDDVRCDGMQPSYQSGGYGIRYTARTSCEAEENYNKVYYLYFEAHGKPGRWRCDDRYISVDVRWDAQGRVVPTAIFLDEYKYTIPKRGILSMYRMATRKSDGSGMKYIVKASCPQLRDYNREFALMLENGGIVTGRWYCEDADRVHGHRVSFSELENGRFSRQLIEDTMGVSNVCARFQTTIDITEFLREWNSQQHDGVWLPPEIFEQKIKKGIIYPKFYYPVMIAGEDGAKIVTSVMQWGITRSWTSDVIRNLRCDKLIQKKTFEAMKKNRCVIPCAGFYEYHKAGKTVLGDYFFHGIDQDTMYMAGLYEVTETGGKYVILTTGASPSVDIHDRMPVVLRRSECKAWLLGAMDFDAADNRAEIVLAKESV